MNEFHIVIVDGPIQYIMVFRGNLNNSFVHSNLLLLPI